MMEKGRSRTAPRATARVKVHSSSLGREEAVPLLGSDTHFFGPKTPHSSLWASVTSPRASRSSDRLRKGAIQLRLYPLYSHLSPYLQKPWHMGEHPSGTHGNLVTCPVTCPDCPQECVLLHMSTGCATHDAKLRGLTSRLHSAQGCGCLSLPSSAWTEQGHPYACALQKGGTNTKGGTGELKPSVIAKACALGCISSKEGTLILLVHDGGGEQGLPSSNLLSVDLEGSSLYFSL